MTRTTIRSEDITAGAVNTSGLEDDIAILGFKVAANGSLAKYNLADQTIDDFQDASGIDASTSTGESRNASNYYSGVSFGSYSTDAFTSTGASTWTCPSNTQEAEVLIVAGGGGGGGRYYAGGGGGGGIVHDTDYAVVAGTVYDITVGAGGSAGAQDAVGGTGGNSVWNVNAEGSGITLTGNGGGGGTYNANSGTTPAGGSGGGAAGGSGASLVGGLSNQASFSGATSYGNAGGASSASNGAGGGGAGGLGQDDIHPNGGVGGVGKYFANFDSYGTDSSNTSGATGGSGSGKGYFGGGGGGAGGGHTSTARAAGGAGGGGLGAIYDPGNNPNTVGYTNTGGGGGGASHHGAYTGAEEGKAGGSGIVLIRHRTETGVDMTLVSNSTTASSEPTTGDIVMTVSAGSGSFSENVDVKAYVSRDNGTTYTQATLSSEGTTGGHTILTAHNVDISSQPSGTSMRYKIETLNQSASKETRIQAVSLGWS
jgi:hypothetical protein